MKTAPDTVKLLRPTEPRHQATKVVCGWVGVGCPVAAAPVPPGQVRHPKGAKGVDADPVPASLSRHGLERPETMEVELLSADRCSVVRPPDKRAPFRPLYDVLARHSGPELTLTVATIERHLGLSLIHI